MPYGTMQARRYCMWEARGLDVLQEEEEERVPCNILNILFGQLLPLSHISSWQIPSDGRPHAGQS